MEGGKAMKKNLVANAVATLAKETATKSVNSACMLFLYQPKVPEKLKKLRKF